MKSETNHLIATLKTAIEALQRIPADASTQEAIAFAQKALKNAFEAAKQETHDEILTNLARQGKTNFEMLVVTSDNFAGELAKVLAKKGIDPDDLSVNELTELHDTAAEYLNGEAMPWAEIINQALANAWPERLGGFYATEQ
jgi:hypothetical protein